MEKAQRCLTLPPPLFALLLYFSSVILLWRKNLGIRNLQNKHALFHHHQKLNGRFVSVCAADKQIHTHKSNLRLPNNSMFKLQLCWRPLSSSIRLVPGLTSFSFVHFTRQEIKNCIRNSFLQMTLKRNNEHNCCLARKQTVFSPNLYFQNAANCDLSQSLL